MSYIRLTQWTCEHDGCEAVIQLSDEGLPSGWVWVFEYGKTTHRCAEHEPLLDPLLVRGRSGDPRGHRYKKEA